MGCILVGMGWFLGGLATSNRITNCASIRFFSLRFESFSLSFRFARFVASRFRFRFCFRFFLAWPTLTISFPFVSILLSFLPGLAHFDYLVSFRFDFVVVSSRPGPLWLSRFLSFRFCCRFFPAWPTLIISFPFTFCVDVRIFLDVQKCLTSIVALRFFFGAQKLCKRLKHF